MTFLQDTLLMLAETLQKHRYLWEPEPFLLRNMPWVDSEPKMQSALLALSGETVDYLLQDSHHCEQWLAEQLPELFNELRRWQPKTYQPKYCSEHEHMSIGIPGRKWQQIQAFQQVIRDLPAVLTTADWCGGKGFLAAYLSAQQGCQVDCLDYDKILCEEGLARIDEYDLPVTFYQRDVLQAIDQEIIDRNERHVALHACGELHRSMMRQTIGHVEQLCLSPCCYHLGAKTHNLLSNTAKNSPLTLSQREMRIPLLETVTGGQQALRNRRTEQIWRLAYDAWRADTTKDSVYRPLKSVSKRFFKQPAREFFSWAAKQHQLEFNEEADISEYLKRGESAFEMSERLGIVRQALKRYIEYFLVLDLACFAEEHGYDTEVVEFCEKTITPRNLLVMATTKNNPNDVNAIFKAC